MKRFDLNKNKFGLMLLIVLLILNYSYCDLPVHCLKHQVIIFNFR